MLTATVTTRDVELPSGGSGCSTAPSRVDQAEQLAFAQALTASLGSAASRLGLRSKQRGTVSPTSDDSLRSGLPMLRGAPGIAALSETTAPLASVSPTSDTVGMRVASPDAESDSRSERSDDSLATPVLFPVQPPSQRQASSRSSSDNEKHLAPPKQSGSGSRSEAVEHGRSGSADRSSVIQSETVAPREVPASPQPTAATPAGQLLPRDVQIAFTASLAEVLGLNPGAWSLSATIQAKGETNGVADPQQPAASLELPTAPPVAAHEIAVAVVSDSQTDTELPQLSATANDDAGTDANAELQSPADQVETPVNQAAGGLPANTTLQSETVAAPVADAADHVLALHEQTRWLEQLHSKVSPDRLNPGKIQISLQVPELGALQIGAMLKDGRLTARLDAESPEARRVLREHLSDLEAALVRQGLTVDLEVNHSGELGEWQGGDARPSSEDARRPNWIEPLLAAVIPEVIAPTPLPAPVVRSRAIRGQLDIQV